jgi:hypothetical protein
MSFDPPEGMMAAMVVLIIVAKLARSSPYDRHPALDNHFRNQGKKHLSADPDQPRMAQFIDRNGDIVLRKCRRQAISEETTDE